MLHIKTSGGQAVCFENWKSLQFVLWIKNEFQPRRFSAAFGVLFQDYTVSVKKITPEDLWQFFQKGWEFLDQILHTY